MSSPESTQIEANPDFVGHVMDAFNRRDMNTMLALAGQDFE